MTLRYQPDMLLLDVQMPVKTGLDVMKEVEKAGLAPITVILSLCCYLEQHQLKNYEVAYKVGFNDEKYFSNVLKNQGHDTQGISYVE